LIVAVLGAILGGVATPTEAASVGAIGALLMAGRSIGRQPEDHPGTAPPRWWRWAASAGLFPVRPAAQRLGLFSDYAAGGVYIVLTLASARLPFSTRLRAAWAASR
jgi:hypothetical protein